jgi:hypothetical protein
LVLRDSELEETSVVIEIQKLETPSIELLQVNQEYFERIVSWSSNLSFKTRHLGIQSIFSFILKWYHLRGNKATQDVSNVDAKITSTLDQLDRLMGKHSAAIHGLILQFYQERSVLRQNQAWHLKSLEAVDLPSISTASPASKSPESEYSKLESLVNIPSALLAQQMCLDDQKLFQKVSIESYAHSILRPLGDCGTVEEHDGSAGHVALEALVERCNRMTYFFAYCILHASVSEKDLESTSTAANYAFGASESESKRSVRFSSIVESKSQPSSLNVVRGPDFDMSLSSSLSSSSLSSSSLARIDNLLVDDTASLPSSLSSSPSTTTLKCKTKRKFYRGRKEEMCLVICFLLKVMRKLKNERNYEGLMHIYGALSMHPISSLDSVWKLVPSKLLAVRDEMHVLLEKNASGYRKLARGTTSVVLHGQLSGDPEVESKVPIQSIIRRDLTFTDENPTWIDHRWINFEKITIIGRILDVIRSCHASARYAFEPHPGVDSYLKTFAPPDCRMDFCRQVVVDHWKDLSKDERKDCARFLSKRSDILPASFGFT